MRKLSCDSELDQAEIHTSIDNRRQSALTGTGMRLKKPLRESITAAAVIACLLSACSSDETVATAGLAQAADSAADAASPELSLRSISTRPWLVTGGDVLLEIIHSPQTNPTLLQLTLNGAELKPQLVQVDASLHQLMLEKLPLGDSELQVTLGEWQTSLSLSNYPISGPIISGPHEVPFLCQTNDFQLVTGATYGPAQDQNCFRETRVDYVYFSQQNQQFRPYAPDLMGPPPPDLARLAELDGQTRPYVVRVETGVVNRAIYEIAMLHDPASPDPAPWVHNEQWNGKLVYTHGGGCGGGWYQQGAATGGVLRNDLLRRGYAVVSSSLNVNGQNCNDLLASETHIMVKERFIEHYGEPVYTIAIGELEGSYQPLQTAANYPGVFDGIIVGQSFPDLTSETIFTLADSRLLHRYFTATNSDGFTTEQQRAVAGFAAHASLANLAREAAWIDPIHEDSLPAEQQGGEVNAPELESLRYDSTNQEGIRATVYDHMVNVFGVVPGTRIARRTLDNAGVQYGLAALNDGIITGRQFIDLNRDIGGFDRDLNPVPRRHRADPEATRRAVESGRILFAGSGLAEIPIIDYRTYTDGEDREHRSDMHMLVYQHSIRQRLLEANGHADNQVLQTGGRWGWSEEAPDLGRLFQEMDRWILAIQADQTARPVAYKVRSNRPSALTDACWDNRHQPRIRINELQFPSEEGVCSELYPVFQTPRQVAGAPLASAVVSCQLEPLSRDSYPISFSEQEWEELLAVFPLGVCDWPPGDTVPARHQGVWKSFGPSPVNRLYFR